MKDLKIKHYNYVLDGSKVLMYFLLILLISTFFEYGKDDNIGNILINNMPVAIISSIIIVFVVEKTMPVKK